MDSSEANLPESKKLLDSMEGKTDVSDILNTIQAYKVALTKEAADKKLWRSPLDSKNFNIVLLSLLLLTIIKFCSNLTFIHIPDKFLGASDKNANIDLVNLILYGIWVIGPPLLFLFEYTIIFGKDERNRMDPIQCADLKYCHDLASKIWAGVGVFLSIILALKYGFKL